MTPNLGSKRYSWERENRPPTVFLPAQNLAAIPLDRNDASRRASVPRWRAGAQLFHLNRIPFWPTSAAKLHHCRPYNSKPDRHAGPSDAVSDLRSTLKPTILTNQTAAAHSAASVAGHARCRRMKIVHRTDPFLSWKLMHLSPMQANSDSAGQDASPGRLAYPGNKASSGRWAKKTSRIV